MGSHLSLLGAARCPLSFSEEGAIWARKLDGVAIDKKEKILYILEFKRTTHQREECEERARARAKRQYEDLVQGLLSKIKDGHQNKSPSEEAHVDL
jgi:hypothetical protein